MNDKMSRYFLEARTKEMLSKMRDGHTFLDKGSRIPASLKIMYKKKKLFLFYYLFILHVSQILCQKLNWQGIMSENHIDFVYCK